MIESLAPEEIKKYIDENEARLRQYVSLLIKANELARLTGPSDEGTLWNCLLYTSPSPRDTR